MVEHDESLTDLLREASNLLPDERPDGESLLDDANFLSRWETSLVSPDEHAELLAQLAASRSMRRQLKQMLDDGILVIPEPSVATADLGTVLGCLTDDVPAPALTDTVAMETLVTETVTTETPDAETLAAESRSPSGPAADDAPAPRVTRKYWNRKSQIAAVVVSLAVVACLLLLRPNQLDRARQELEAGEYELAYARLSQYGGGGQDFTNLLERAAHGVGLAELAGADFDRASTVTRQAEQQGAGSARLTNIDLQARRGIPSPNAFEFQPFLFDYDFESQPVGSKEPRELAQAYEAARQRYADPSLLDVNHAHLLVHQGQFQAARDALVRAAKLPGARVGLGIVSFGTGTTLKDPVGIEFRKALATFQQLRRDHPGDVANFVNAAICHRKLGEDTQSNDLLNRALEITDDEAIRARIQRLLAEGTNQVSFIP